MRDKYPYVAETAFCHRVSIPPYAFSRTRMIGVGSFRCRGPETIFSCENQSSTASQQAGRRCECGGEGCKSTQTVMHDDHIEWGGMKRCNGFRTKIALRDIGKPVLGKTIADLQYRALRTRREQPIEPASQVAHDRAAVPIGRYRIGLLGERSSCVGGYHLRCSASDDIAKHAADHAWGRGSM